MSVNNYYHYNYFHIPSPLAEKALLVSDCMGYTADSDFLVHRKTFYNHLAFFVYKGTFYVEQYGKKLTLGPGSCGIMNLMDAHLYYSDSKDVAHLLWFHFRGAGTKQLLQVMHENGHLPYTVSDFQMAESFCEAFRLTESGASETEIANHLYSVLMEILKDYSFGDRKNVQIPEELQKTILFMEENLYKDVTLEMLSSNANMGKYHFGHLFKKWYGISPMRYYNNKKLEEACRLLKTAEKSVDEIAELLSYTDSGYFRKVFKEYFGISPSKYRKNIL